MTRVTALATALMNKGFLFIGPHENATNINDSNGNEIASNLLTELNKLGFTLCRLDDLSF